jgi:hypothetical protein
VTSRRIRGLKNFNVKLPAHRAGLPEEEVSFILCPFLPAGRQGPRLSRFGGTGHVSVKLLVFESASEFAVFIKGNQPWLDIFCLSFFFYFFMRFFAT